MSNTLRYKSRNRLYIHRLRRVYARVLRRLGLNVQKEGVELVVTRTTAQRKRKIEHYKRYAQPEFTSSFSEHNRHPSGWHCLGHLPNSMSSI